MIPNKRKANLKGIPDVRQDYRQDVGGEWEEVGKWQLNLLKLFGLQPHHTLLDVGCGSLRGGIHFIDYLDKGNYHGVEMIEGLVQCGIYHELGIEKYKKKLPKFKICDDFDAGPFGITFDYILAQSLASHLNESELNMLMFKMRKVMRGRTKFMMTYFPKLGKNHLTHLYRTNKKNDPVEDRHKIFYYSRSDIRRIAKDNGMYAYFTGHENKRGQKVVHLGLDFRLK